MTLHIPFRYDFFTIWGNGLSYKEEILDVLRNEKYLEILRIELKKVNNMKRFVYKLYACDTVPLEHIRAKLTYLFRAKSEIMVVFVKNYNQKETPAGMGAFRNVQCQYINQIKLKIRNKYNPKHPDKDFHILPLDRGVTHEHVIHASDYEEQVDYFLKMLGYENGLYFLHGDCDELPFSLPYYIKRPKSYMFKTRLLEDLRASILNDNNSDNMVKIAETPHYRSLINNSGEYSKYLEKYKYNLLTPDYSWKQFKKLSECSRDEVKRFDRIVVKQEYNYFFHGFTFS